MIAALTREALLVAHHEEYHGDARVLQAVLAPDDAGHVAAAAPLAGLADKERRVGVLLSEHFCSACAPFVDQAVGLGRAALRGGEGGSLNGGATLRRWEERALARGTLNIAAGGRRTLLNCSVKGA